MINAHGEAFIVAMYKEALQLAEQMRYGLPRVRDVSKAQDLNIEEQLNLTAELLRLSSRIMHSMAWLMARRAVSAGEITEEEAMGADYCLDGQEICLRDPAVDKARMPPVIVDLMDRSEQLYRRIIRIDAELARRRDQGRADPVQRLQADLTARTKGQSLLA
ncbi:MAG: DUF1465 family protein [Rhodothalassiaceae bacterium]